MQQSDGQLLEAYAREQSHEAFAVLVGRHMGLVYGTARRLMRDAHLAEDVAQTVFLLLARKAKRLPVDVNLAGWLHRATVLTAQEVRRGEARRKRREGTAAERMRAAEGDDHGPDLDGVIARLPAGERDVLVLRYLKERSVPEVAEICGIGREAAAKRLTRGLARLRRLCGADAEAAMAGLAVAPVAPELITRAVLVASGVGEVPARVQSIMERAQWRFRWVGAYRSTLLAAGLAVVVATPLLLTWPVRVASGPTTAAVVTAAPQSEEHTVDLMTPEMLPLWWITSDKSDYTINANGELVVHSASGRGPAFLGHVGGMTLDNYRFSLEFIVDDLGTPGQAQGQAVQNRGNWNVQISPRKAFVFCQVFANACNICCVDKREKEPFRHLSDQPNTAYRPGEWNHMEVTAEGGVCQLVLNGAFQARASVPISTEGMLGLLVNFDADGTVRIRNLQLTLLKPTPQQVKELQAPAQRNWEKWVAEEKAAGRLGEL